MRSCDLTSCSQEERLLDRLLERARAREGDSGRQRERQIETERDREGGDRGRPKGSGSSESVWRSVSESSSQTNGATMRSCTVGESPYGCSNRGLHA